MIWWFELLLVMSSSVKPIRWEHGWKTPNVIATRYTNQYMGYNIGFRFPNHPDCDSPVVFEFFEKDRRGWVYQGGGAPGAEMFVRFEDVKDKASADVKIPQILPALDSLVVRICH